MFCSNALFCRMALYAALARWPSCHHWLAVHVDWDDFPFDEIVQSQQPTKSCSSFCHCCCLARELPGSEKVSNRHLQVALKGTLHLPYCPSCQMLTYYIYCIYIYIYICSSTYFAEHFPYASRSARPICRRGTVPCPGRFAMGTAPQGRPAEMGPQRR